MSDDLDDLSPLFGLAEEADGLVKEAGNVDLFKYTAKQEDPKEKALPTDKDKITLKDSGLLKFIPTGYIGGFYRITNKQFNKWLGKDVYLTDKPTTEFMGEITLWWLESINFLFTPTMIFGAVLFAFYGIPTGMMLFEWAEERFGNKKKKEEKKEVKDDKPAKSTKSKSKSKA